VLISATPFAAASGGKVSETRPTQNWLMHTRSACLAAGPTKCVQRQPSRTCAGWHTTIIAVYVRN